MSKMVTDQADGLRRLLAHTPTRVVAVAGMGRGMGTTTVAMNLGAALVQQGKEVLLLDEQAPSADTACGAWSLDPLGTLGDVVDQRLTCEGASAQSDCGVSVLPAPLGAAAPEVDPRALLQGGVILIDTVVDAEGRLSALAQTADELVLVMQPHPSSITAAYAGIKRLHYAHAIKQLRFLVNGIADPQSAEQIMGNLVNTGNRYLAVSLQPAGWVRTDPHLKDARRLHQTVVEAFPASAAAIDFRRVAVDMGQWPWRPAPRRTAGAFDGGAHDTGTPLLRARDPRGSDAAA